MEEQASGRSGTILVVDDAPEIRVLVRGVLEAESYQVETAETGAEALACLERSIPDLVLLDVDLPDIQGTTLCRKLRKEGQRVPIVMLTCHNKARERAAGLDCGADDYIGKPFVPEELLARIRAQLRREDRIAMMVEELLREKWERINHGLQLTQQLQQPWTQTQHIEGISHSIHHVPVGRIGGDFFLLEDLDEDRCAVVIGDTMGKGVGASLVMSWTLSVVWELVHQDVSPARMMRELNETVGRELEELGVFVALFCGIYYRKERRFQYCCAGTEPPIWIRNGVNGRRHVRLSTPGVPVGVLLDFPYENGTCWPQPGDRLFLYTDGLTEAVPVDEQAAVFRSLYRTLLSTPNLPMREQGENVMRTLRTRTPDLHLRDDLTFLLLEIPGGPAASRPPHCWGGTKK